MDKKYDYTLHEKQAQDQWQKEQTYTIDHAQGPLYSIDTPPPTVSGALHIGHIFSYTQTDISARYKRMSGFSVFYPFGFDDNGLPTERFVEKTRAISAHSMKRSEFINICLEETIKVEADFQQLWQRMGLSVDWSQPYSTISAATRKISQESFIRLFNKGFIYRKHEPALYCTVCRTSVAQAELDDAEKTSFFNDIIFKLDDGTELIIGTTRPEFLPSCVALFYNPTDKRYQRLQGKTAQVPLFNYTVPIYADEMVDPEKGTGLVMCCTFGDKNDITWYKKYNLPYKPLINLDGRLKESTGFLAGLKIIDARNAVLEKLKEQGLLREQKPITRFVNVHERCKNEIEYVAISQWFLRILEYKDKFIALGNQITWHPPFMKARYQNWVENIQWDWCLSRQRFFGIPFPAWHCTACEAVLLAPLESLPIDPQESPYPGTQCPQCSSTALVADTDVMDTWNTSSLTPYICYSLFNKEITSPFTDNDIMRFLPMGMRPQAHDIIRTWAFYTIIKVWMHQETIPWDTIVISGHVLSDNKEKLSKSKENSKTNPDFLLKTYPADAIRYWTASGNLGQDVAFSETQIAIGQRLITKLWNAFLFIAEHTSKIPLGRACPEYLGTVNEWILHKATLCFTRYQQYLDKYEFNLALDTVESFFWHDVCDNYLELIKEQLFKPELYSKGEIDSTHWTLYTIGLRILQLYAPYLPHVTESIYQELYKNYCAIPSIHKTNFGQVQIGFSFEYSISIMNLVIMCIMQVRKLKTEHKYSLKTPIDVLELYSSQEHNLTLLKKQEQLIKGVTHATKITYNTSTLPSAILETHSNMVYVKVIVQH